MSRGKWCSTCKHKTEKKILKILSDIFTVKTQKTFNWCKYKKTKRNAKYDFFIKKYKILIELDGPQHFKQVYIWESPKKAFKKDIFKIKKSIKKGYTIIHLLQEDVLADKNKWDKKLLKQIRKHKNPKCVFIDSKNVYQKYINKLKKKEIKYKVK